MRKAQDPTNDIVIELYGPVVLCTDEPVNQSLILEKQALPAVTKTVPPMGSCFQDHGRSGALQVPDTRRARC